MLGNMKEKSWILTVYTVQKIRCKMRMKEMVGCLVHGNRKVKSRISNSVHSAGLRCKMRMKEMEGCLVHRNMNGKSRIFSRQVSKKINV